MPGSLANGPLVGPGGIPITPLFAVHDSLVQWTADSEGAWGPRPLLAESWDLQRDSATFRLRRGVKFHDGTELTAVAAARSIERAVRKASILPAGLVCFDREAPALAIDQDTLKLNLRGPCPPLLALLSDASWNPVIIRPIQGEQLDVRLPELQPVGTGPFQLEEWRPSESVALRRFETYWQRDEDGRSLPYLDGVVYRVVADDTSALQELRAGRLHLATGLQGKDIGAARANGLLEVLVGRWSGKVHGLGISARGPLSIDPKLRQAAVQGLDREGLVNSLAPGSGIAGYVPLLNGNALGANPGTPADVYDNLYDRDGAADLVRRSAQLDGVEVRLAAPGQGREGEAIREMWSAIGIRAALTALDKDARTDNDGQTQPDAVVLATAITADPAGTLAALWQEHVYNEAGRRHFAEVEACLSGSQATYETGARQQANRRCQQMLDEGGFYWPLWLEPSTWVYRNTVKGMASPFDATHYSLARVWLEPESDEVPP